MSAIVTDQIRILNATKFLEEVSSSDNAFYSFVALTNPEDYVETWDEGPPAPKDCFDEESHNWDNIVGLKKILSSDVRFAVRKLLWTSGTTYDMYRHNINRNNLSQPSQSTSLYSSNFFVVNRDFKVYICLNNGTSPENPNGRPSLDEPKFVDLEPRSAGTSNDGYIWKYLFTVNPNDIIKFDTLDYFTVPTDWKTSDEYQPVRDNASISGQLKVALITNRGIDVGQANQVYTCNIIGDGTGAVATIVVNNQSKVDSITISQGGSGYTYGRVDLNSGGFPTTYTTKPEFDVIIPPKNGHGADIYRELGCTKILIYSQIKNDLQNPDFIVGNKVSRIGLIKNPLSFNSTQLLNKNQASALKAIKLIGTNSDNDYQNATFTANSTITQTVGTGITAVGRVVSYNKNTGVLKYWQDRTLYGFEYDLSKSSSDGIYGNEKIEFTTSLVTGGSLQIVGSNQSLKIDNNFNGDVIAINNQNYYLGQTFENGLADPEVEKYSGDLIYVDNRPSIIRSENQREDIKIVLQF